MKKIIISVLFIGSALSLWAYGPTGHRAVSAIAQEHLNCRAKRAIKKLLGDENLVLVSTYGDDIKSDKAYDFSYTWHYVNMKDGETYLQSIKNPKGDLVTAFNHCVATLKDKSSSVEDKRFCLKILVHLVGDAHQPLHIGRAEDRGGNDIKVKWFGRKSNLHRVWDENMISSYRMSYSELAENMPKISRKVRKEWQKGDMLTWTEEMRTTTAMVYASAEQDEDLGYRYMYDYFETLRHQLHKAGIRLAGVLNDIF
ncbi:S1/P1 nuclease [Balneicella halophila]|uniref:S1/P1 nuclease n=2 Tax=Balneicella halophila TaxID=1537566 RepID=A0A7L4URR2_BALHA|nr:S1/P1 nuclease [Balneicella halophila]